MDLSTIPFLAKGQESTDEEEMPYEETATQSPACFTKQRRKPCIYFTALMFIVVLVLFGVISILRPNSAAPDVYRPETLGALNICDCGSAVHEALSRNCVYDTLATAWLPPHCRDDELTAEFKRSGPGADGSWPYFADPEGKIPVNKSHIAALGETNGMFWAMREWHVAHCLFYWQKYIRMRDTGVVMERRFDQIAHVKHCGRLAMHEHNHSMLIEVNVVMNSDIDHGDEPGP
ncbi:uncharacterized protein TRUGW13939_02455 [Talaromyces rugulosus]|uniref:Uncharacterized protein n=1 Tax=Talaromyces rugulosus TaxID=121627 RepID=A0A7H8QQD1_TALRU|nr:uncharacterized protein TRUGW13939_02455 [Talaromyces rugulosus]QKX55363.1 hypothetical protein TRUGW13939_02455 [Talaromyces rugulosus]